MKKLSGEIDFFLRQKLFVFAVAVTAVCGYGFAITHGSIGVDDTMVGVYLDEGLEISLGRWTIFLINKIFRIGEFSPFITELAGMLFLLLGAVLYCVLVRRIFGDRIGISGYTAFAGAFVSFPFTSEIWVYYFHDGVDIGYVLTALALLCFLDGMDRTGKNSLRSLLASLLFVWVAVGCYESFLVLYLLGVILILFFRGITGREELTFKWLFRNLIRCGGVAAGCVVLRALAQVVFAAVFSLETVDSGLLTDFRMLFRNGEWLQNMVMLLKKYWLVYFVNGAVYFPITVYVLAVSVFGIAAVVYTVKKKNGWFLLLFLGMIVTPAILTFIRAQLPFYRHCQYMPLFVASAVLLLYCFLVREKTGRAGSLIFAVLASCLIWNQAYELNYNFYTDYRKYEHDREVLTEIAWTVAKDYGKDAAVIFTGSYTLPYDLLKRYCVDYSSKEFARISFLTDWLDPQLKEKYYSPYGYSFAGEAQYSVIDWGMFAYGRQGMELIHFLEMHGYEMRTVEDAELIEAAERYAEGLPEWPRQGSVTEWNGYVVVHF